MWAAGTAPSFVLLQTEVARTHAIQRTSVLKAPPSNNCRISNPAEHLQHILPQGFERKALEAGSVLEAGNAQGCDGRSAVAADEARRVEPGEAVDKAHAQQHGRERGAALDEHAG